MRLSTGSLDGQKERRGDATVGCFSCTSTGGSLHQLPAFGLSLLTGAQFAVWLAERPWIVMGEISIALINRMEGKIPRYTGDTIVERPLRGFLAFRRCSGVWNRKFDIVHLICELTEPGTIRDASGHEITGTELIQRCCDQNVKWLWAASDNPANAT